ncbi:MAG: hypothetical protein WB445_10325 [Acinetobacter sp.]
MAQLSANRKNSADFSKGQFAYFAGRLRSKACFLTNDAAAEMAKSKNTQYLLNKSIREML